MTSSARPSPLAMELEPSLITCLVTATHDTCSALDGATARETACRASCQHTLPRALGRPVPRGRRHAYSLICPHFGLWRRFRGAFPVISDRNLRIFWYLGP